MPETFEDGESLPARSSNVRRRLLRDLAILFLGTAAAILVVAMLLGARAKTEIATSWIERTTEESRKAFRAYFDTLERGLIIAQKWGRSGVLDLDAVPSLNAKFMPILEEMQIQAVVIGCSHGASYYLRREEDGWLTRTTRPEARPGEASWQRWSRDQKLLESWTEPSGYDPRKRSWFQGALDVKDKRRVFWTDPYLFYSTGTPGISVSMAWKGEKEPHAVFVIGFDVPLHSIYDLLTGLEISGQGVSVYGRRPDLRSETGG